MNYYDTTEQASRERDDARRELCELQAQLDGADCGLSCAAKVAQDRGWEYLYPNDPFFDEDDDDADA